MKGYKSKIKRLSNNMAMVNKYVLNFNNYYRTLLCLMLILCCISADLIAQNSGNELKPVLSTKNNLYGYSDATGKVVIDYKYKLASEFYNNMARVQIGDFWGLINKDGAELLPFKYCYIDFIKEPELFIKVGMRDTKNPNGTTVGIFEKSFKEVLPCVYYSIRLEQNLFIIISNPTNVMFTGNRYGIANLKGQVLVEPINPEEIKFNSDGLAILKTLSGATEKYGVLKNTGEIIIPFDYKKIDGIGIYYPLISATTFEDKFVFYNSKFKKVSDTAFTDKSMMGSNIFIVTQDKVRWGFLDETGLKTPLEYDKQINRFNNGLITIKKNGKSGVMDENYKLIVPCEYDEVEYSKLPKNIRVKKKEKYGIYNLAGKNVVPCEADFITEADYNGFFIYKKNGKLGMSDLNSKITIPFMIDESYMKTNYQQGNAYCNQILKTQQNNEDALYFLAYGAYITKTPVIALTYVNDLISKNRGIYSMHPVRVLINISLKDYENAKLDCENNIIGKPKMKAYIALAKAQYKDGKFREAAESYEKGSLDCENCSEVVAFKTAYSEEMKKKGIELREGKQKVLVLNGDNKTKPKSDWDILVELKEQSMIPGSDLKPGMGRISVTETESKKDYLTMEITDEKGNLVSPIVSYFTNVKNIYDKNAKIINFQCGCNPSVFMNNDKYKNQKIAVKFYDLPYGTYRVNLISYYENDKERGQRTKTYTFTFSDNYRCIKF
jgi:tetratricopeptide (TPR) repeat protein